MVSFLTRLVEMIAPRACCVCGNRLLIGEEHLCASCIREIPYTDYHRDAENNKLARLFWKRLPIEKASSLFYFEPKAEYANIIYDLKYHGCQEIGRYFGRFAAQWYQKYGFFDGVDIIIPIPLAKKRQRERGYNQSEMIARGLSEITGITVVTDAVIRVKRTQTQTRLLTAERQKNVQDAFMLKDGDKVRGKHVLIIDDIITTGATICACADEIVKAGGVKISVFSLGHTRG